ncbi:MAG: hypothetical protein HKO62_13720, partial [Gammaproteobacteria bacterium]|nr:hypothetical protein [Gammaproteobacteria bacterium]
LRLIAIFVVLLNWINSTGEYILSEMVVRWADAEVATGTAGADKEALIAWFYGNFSFWVTLIALLIQTFVVARLLRYLGMSRSLMILPLISAIGYAVIAFVPIFSIVRLVKISENAVDYSLATTLRQTLFLPTSREEKYEGKTAIDTFFWRFGDLIQGGAIYVGINAYQFGVAEFAMANLVLAALWTLAAAMIAQEYPRVVAANMTSRPPVLNRPIPDHVVPTGRPLDFVLEPDTFIDPDPGDVVILRASLANGEPLPPWLRFNSRARRFVGTPPAGAQSITVRVVASDLEHLTADDLFTIQFSDQPV